MFIATHAEDSHNINQTKDKNRRGINVFTMSEIMGVTGNTKSGARITAEVQLPTFLLHPMERESIARLNDVVLGVVTSRMNRISSLKWGVERKSKDEDKLVYALKSYKQLYDEYGDLSNVKHGIIRRRMFVKIKEELADVKEDLSNFDSSLRRWKKRIHMATQISTEEIQDWIDNLNKEDDFEEYKKKWVFDMMIHGASASYKQYIDGLLENIYMLPGGSVYPMRSKYVGGSTGYVQMIPGFDPTIYFRDEMLFNKYIPISARSYGLLPLEALINKISESMLFDKLAADRADGTKPPEKIVVFGETGNLFSELGNVDLDTAMDKHEQNRLETKFNEERKNAVVTLSGHGHPTVLDISKADTFQAQSDRQEKIKKAVALVYNMSNMEVNLSGGDDTSGRSTSESQERIEREKGIYPMVRIIDKMITKQWIPFKFGTGWKFEHNTGISDAEQIKLDTMKAQAGSYDVNQIREGRGDDPYPEEKYNRPESQEQEPAGESEMNPMFTREAR